MCVYGANEPDAAAASIRVAVHSLRKKIRETGLSIRAEPSVGYEIEATDIPGPNRSLSDRILIALNTARSTDEHEMAASLKRALSLEEVKREKWAKDGRSLLQAALAA